MIYRFIGLVLAMNGHLLFSGEPTPKRHQPIEGPELPVLDLIFANDNNGPSRVYFNDGQGEFTLSQDLATDRYFSLDLGDLNGDGAPDIFLAACCGNPARVWFNDGLGQFSDSGQAIGTAMGETYDVKLGDLDGDGDLDAFLAENFNFILGEGFANHVYLNDGNGFFSNSGQELGSSFSHSVALGDLDDDGDLDAFVANINCDSARIWINDGKGTFSDSGQTFGNEGSEAISLGDLDGDGDLDAAMVNGFCAASNNLGTRILLNDGFGTFSDSGQRLGTFDSKAIALGDIDNDDDLDLVVGNDGFPNTVWLNDGTAQFSNSGAVLAASTTKAVALGDVDGDGDLDIVCANGSDTNRVWLNDGVTFSDSGQIFNNPFSRDIALLPLISTCNPLNAAAGPDQWVCGTQTLLAAEPPANGIGTWSITAGSGGVLTDINDPLSGFSGLPSTSYTLQWTIGALACEFSDEVRITLTDDIETTLPAWPNQHSVLQLASFVEEGCS